jgi:hypothetical protein
MERFDGHEPGNGMTSNRKGHIRITSHPEPGAASNRHPIHWGSPDPAKRGPIIGTVSRPQDRNVIGAHGGTYSLYRALAVSSGALNAQARACAKIRQLSVAPLFAETIQRIARGESVMSLFSEQDNLF